MEEEREEVKGTYQWLEGNESSLDTMSVKMELMNETTEILMEQHNWIKGLVNSRKAKLRMMEEELYFMDEWQ
jgi:uncharacterized protein YoxC